MAIVVGIIIFAVFAILIGLMIAVGLMVFSPYNWGKKSPPKPPAQPQQPPQQPPA